MTLVPCTLYSTVGRDSQSAVYCVSKKSCTFIYGHCIAKGMTCWTYFTGLHIDIKFLQENDDVV